MNERSDGNGRGCNTEIRNQISPRNGWTRSASAP